MNSEKILGSVVCEEHERELSALQENEEMGIEFDVSPQFQRKMKHLIASNRRKAMVLRTSWRAAGFFAAVCTSTLLLCAINEDVRAECLRWFRMLVPDGTTEYEMPPVSDTEKSSGTLVGFELGYVPEGFVLEKSDIKDRRGIIRYRKKDVVLEFLYVLSHDDKLWTDNEHGDFTSITLEDGSVCEYYQGDVNRYASRLIWKRDGGVCSLMLWDNGEERGKVELMRTANEVRAVHTETDK